MAVHCPDQRKASAVATEEMEERCGKQQGEKNLASVGVRWVTSYHSEFSQTNPMYSRAIGLAAHIPRISHIPQSVSVKFSSRSNCHLRQ